MNRQNPALFAVQVQTDADHVSAYMQQPEATVWEDNMGGKRQVITMLKPRQRLSV